MEYYLDPKTVTVKQRIEKTTKRYVAKTLTKIEETPPREHKEIIKRHMYWMMQDILTVIDEK